MPRKKESTTIGKPRRTRKKVELDLPDHSFEDFAATPIPTVTEVHTHRFQWSPLKSFIVGFGCGMALLSFLIVLVLLSSAHASSSSLRAADYPTTIR